MAKHVGIYIGWSIPGGGIKEGNIPAREAKSVGAKIHIYGLIRKFVVYYKDNWGDDRFPWKLVELLTYGTSNPHSAESESVDEFSAMREAIAEGKRKARDW